MCSIFGGIIKDASIVRVCIRLELFNPGCSSSGLLGKPAAGAPAVYGWAPVCVRGGSEDGRRMHTAWTVRTDLFYRTNSIVFANIHLSPYTFCLA